MGAKGFSGVGINETLIAAQVPKGAFDHYFGSREALGEAILADHLAEPALKYAERLMNYWRKWQSTQGGIDYQRKCLPVKLANGLLMTSQNPASSGPAAERLLERLANR
ncbi:TetR/AcrR family transcriptional regulator [Methylobacterium sp. J-026]|uniref:TetR/AcrR family transcriptional regulator n=1 Tax=Methylobacterium sp. J-026 TaxID=2836624 RepID=UPI001FBAECF5|nr:TetR/AcrR family transcriptional regulator [Methylobacterium sp. J-026]MCJ2133273.1 TetR/AcrR family transcriptional regulator [Methylobacterium sp. J-026]